MDNNFNQTNNQNMGQDANQAQNQYQPQYTTVQGNGMEITRHRQQQIMEQALYHRSQTFF